MISNVIKSDDVQFYWLIATADFEEEDNNEVTDVLLKKFVELYVTMRGFSHVRAWMEKYKQSTTKSTQRSKSLRRDLHDSNSYGSNCNCVIILICHACTCKIHHLNVFHILQPNQLISFLNA